jgi:hypothetical protein
VSEIFKKKIENFDCMQKEMVVRSIFEQIVGNIVNKRYSWTGIKGLNSRGGKQFNYICLILYNFFLISISL